MGTDLFNHQHLATGEKGDSEVAKNYYRLRSPEQRMQLRSHLQRMINQSTGKVTYFNKAGKALPKGECLYLVPWWEKGLELLEEVMKDKNEIV